MFGRADKPEQGDYKKDESACCDPVKQVQVADDTLQAAVKTEDKQ